MIKNLDEILWSCRDILDEDTITCKDFVSEIADKIFSAFDNLFFLSTIGEKGADVQIKVHIIDTKADKHPYGHYIEDRNRIEIYCRSNYPIWRMIDTILHEMTHAFLHSWGCAECCRYLSETGVTGHGYAWLKITFILKKFMISEFKWNYDPSILTSLGREFTYSQVSTNQEVIDLFKEWEMEKDITTKDIKGWQHFWW